jgi:hypothetical protein
VSNQLLRRIDSESKREYPKVGEPLLAECLDWDKQRVSRYIPHIITAKGQGTYLNYWVEEYERAWEISMQKVGELRKCGENLILF